MAGAAETTEDAPLSRSARALALGVLAGVLLVGAMFIKSPHDEIFPFSAFNLFSFVPNEVERVDARVVERGGRAVARPEVVTAVRAVRRRMTVQDLFNFERVADALAAGAPASEVPASRLVARLFEPGDVVELVRIRFRPLERYRSGRYEVADVYGRFTVPSP